MTLVLATRNTHKVREIGEILGDGLVLLSLADFPEVGKIPEEGDTFGANAAQKALFVARALDLPAMADDSGLEVDALDGIPGVRSARFAGEGAADADNIAKLLGLMRDVPAGKRGGRFRCTIAVAWPDGSIHTAEGVCEGRLLWGLRGSRGFGYDPLFVPEGYEQTFAELDPEVKNRISHRGRALRSARDTILRRYLG